MQGVLVAGCLVLVVTPHCLLRLLDRRIVGLKRLCHLVSGTFVVTAWLSNNVHLFLVRRLHICCFVMSVVLLFQALDEADLLLDDFSEQVCVFVAALAFEGVSRGPGEGARPGCVGGRTLVNTLFEHHPSSPVGGDQES